MRPVMVLWNVALVAPAILAAAGLAMVAGCGGPTRRDDAAARGAADRLPASAEDGRAMREQLLGGAVSILNSLDRYDEARGSEQVFDRLVQWGHAAGGITSPERDPLLESLPANLRTAGEAILNRDTFDAAGDVGAIRDRCWLAAVARTARGGGVDDLAVAESLFSWTVRSLAPVGDPPMVPTESSPGSRWFMPGEIMLAGRASGPQRAWIFVELLRQAGLDGVMLATAGTGGGPPRPWLPALVSGGEAYLFEPTYGMPVPGPGGVGIATARQAADDPSILAALSLPERSYPVTAADVQNVGVLVVADPWSLSSRMARLETELAPQQGVHVFVDASAAAERAAAAVPAGANATQGLWTFPWETVARRPLAAQSLVDELGPLELPMPGPGGALFRPLFAGRVRQFRGDLDGPAGAKAAYMAARLSRRAMAAAVSSLPEPQAIGITKRFARIKEDATYWLGLVMLAEGENAAAVDYLERMTLEASPDSRWTDAARINLATALIDLDRLTEAIAVLREDGSPQRFGSRLLAARLQAETNGKVLEEPAEATEGLENQP